MENITKFRKYKNILNSCLKQAEENFYQNIFSILLYINDIQNAATKTHSRLFADDTAIFMHNKNVIELMHQGTGPMKRIIEWFITNKLWLSLGKSNFVLFHGRR